MTTEIYRLIRHAIAPLVAWLVASGHLPAYMQGDITEAAVLAVGLLAPLVLSKLREK